MLCKICKNEEGVNKYGSFGKYRICHNCSKNEYEKRKNYIKNWHKNNRDKVLIAKNKYSRTKRKVNCHLQDSVRNIVSYAIRSGKLKRGICRVCKKINAQAHHDDYSKPFNIKWFCPTHHRQYEEFNKMRKKKY